MKVLCDQCGKNQAHLFCFQDDASLCKDCDRAVHGNGGVAAKHHRVPIANAPQTPLCDVCEENKGVTFCKDERSILCSKCDITIHSKDAQSQGHERFFFTGMRIGLRPLPACCATQSTTTSNKGGRRFKHIPVTINPTVPDAPIVADGFTVSLRGDSAAAAVTAARSSPATSNNSNKRSWDSLDVSDALGVQGMAPGYSMGDVVADDDWSLDDLVVPDMDNLQATPKASSKAENEAWISKVANSILPEEKMSAYVPMGLFEEDIFGSPMHGSKRQRMQAEECDDAVVPSMSPDNRHSVY